MNAEKYNRQLLFGTVIGAMTGGVIFIIAGNLPPWASPILIIIGGAVGYVAILVRWSDQSDPQDP